MTIRGMQALELSDETGDELILDIAEGRELDGTVVFPGLIEELRSQGDRRPIGAHSR